MNSAMLRISWELFDTHSGLVILSGSFTDTPDNFRRVVDFIAGHMRDIVLSDFQHAGVASALRRFEFRTHASRP
jgi:hypothetical protein